MDNSKTRIRPYVLILGIVLIVIVGIVGIFLVKRPVVPLNPFIAKPTVTPTPDPLAPKNFLLLGYAGGKHEGGALTDTMIVVHIIPKEQRVILVSIPRDLWIDLPLLPNGQIKPSKINSAYAYGIDSIEYPDRPEQYKGSQGGIALAKYAVSYVINEPIAYAGAVSFDGFVKSIDALGGIDINVPFSFEDTFYPLADKETDTCGKSEEDIKKTIATLSGFFLEKEFPCRYETIKFEKGNVHMDGSTALKFVRSRHSDVNGGDFGRSLRQQAFIRSLKTKLLKGTIAQILSFIKSVSSIVRTDLNVSDISKLIDLYGNISSYSIRSVGLTEDNVLVASNSADGQYILVPKTSWDDVHTFVKKEFTKNEATPSASQ